MTENIAFIGGGNMARAVACGLIESGFPSRHIRIAEPNAATRQRLSVDLPGATIGDDNDTIADGANTLVLAVKPQVLPYVCRGLAPVVQAGKPLIVSIAAGVRMGVCTTSNPKAFDGVLDLLGPARKARFEFVLACDIVAKKKPDPEIYELAKQKLALPANDCVVIEDSRNGMLAALGAQLPVLITTSTYTVDEDFTGAIGVVRELGDAPNIHITLDRLAELTANR